MPRIIIQSDVPDAYVTHTERVCSTELQSDHYSRQLIERVAWAVSDAEQTEREYEPFSRRREKSTREQPRELA